jgi:predicted nucleic acid-binding protein
VKYLVDTNVVSETRKGVRTNAAVRAWSQSIERGSVAISVLTLGEIRKGIEGVRRHDEFTAFALERWLRELISEHHDRILDVTREIAEEWARMTVPDPLPIVDGLLAATAKVHGLTLVTRNVKDVRRTGVSVLNPFEALS